MSHPLLLGRPRGQSTEMKLSAGLLVYRLTPSTVEVLLVHPGGPYWTNRDDGAWSLPKGEYGPDEDPLEVAIREFREELGSDPPADRSPEYLGELRQPSGKRVSAWALQGDLDVGTVRSNTFTIEWPPRSGVTREFPEVDRAGWFDLEAARRKLVSGQVGFIDRLSELVQGGGSASARDRM
jgi:predicted NUDIX family NTP pyrophosphohydrolase